MSRPIPSLVAVLSLAGPACAAPGAQSETVEQALCRLIETAAVARDLPVPFLTRLIFRESSFRIGVVSAAGAQGVAQFMPGTARERGLSDPFDPEQAIPHAASFLADLRRQFGNLGLAAAAYNGGPGRVSAWLAGSGGLPGETRAYVLAVTGRAAEAWRPGVAPHSAAERIEPDATDVPDTKPSASPPADQTCLQVTAALRVPSRGDRFALPLEGGPAAPWGVQLAGNFSKSLALSSFARARNRYASVIGDVRPMVIGTRFLNRGTRAFYRVRIPAESRQAADTLCGRIRAVGGACLVLRT